jgi:hypothetical protein
MSGAHDRLVRTPAEAGNRAALRGIAEHDPREAPALLP